jgi:folylpolyglutamate synthase/dihydropteroate synthase
MKEYYNILKYLYKPLNSFLEIPGVVPGKVLDANGIFNIPGPKDRLRSIDQKVIRMEENRKICEILGNPFKKYDVIHVVGTNGKGSVSAKLAQTLKSANYKVGLLTSPHLYVFRERIRVNDELISKEDFVRVWNEILHKIAPLLPGLTAITPFVLHNVLAMEYFSQQNCDVGNPIFFQYKTII